MKNKMNLSIEDIINLKIKMNEIITRFDINLYCREIDFNNDYELTCSLCCFRDNQIKVDFRKYIDIKKNFDIEMQKTIYIKTKSNKDLIEGFYKMKATYEELKTEAIN